MVLISKFAGHHMEAWLEDTFESKGKGLDAFVLRKVPVPLLYGLNGAEARLPTLPTHEGLVTLGGMAWKEELPFGTSTTAIGRLYPSTSERS